MTAHQLMKKLETLAKLDSHALQTLSAYSHAAAATDRTRIAVEQDRRIPAEAGERAVRRAAAAEGEALAGVIEMIETPDPRDRQRLAICDELAAAGIKNNYRSLGMARHIRDRVQSYLTYRSLCERERAKGKPAPRWEEMLAAFAGEMRTLGVEGV